MENPSCSRYDENLNLVSKFELILMVLWSSYEEIFCYASEVNAE